MAELLYVPSPVMHLAHCTVRYYDFHDVCKTIKCQPPKQEVIKSALINAGYRWGGEGRRVGGGMRHPDSSHASPSRMCTAMGSQLAPWFGSEAKAEAGWG
jgi:hypothetical protein